MYREVVDQVGVVMQTRYTATFDRRVLIFATPIWGGREVHKRRAPFYRSEIFLGGHRPKARGSSLCDDSSWSSLCFTYQYFIAYILLENSNASLEPLFSSVSG